MKKIKQLCQYKFIGCQKLATFQHFIKLEGKRLNKGFICLKCKEIIEKNKWKI